MQDAFGCGHMYVRDFAASQGLGGGISDGISNQNSFSHPHTQIIFVGFDPFSSFSFANCCVTNCNQSDVTLGRIVDGNSPGRRVAQ